MIVFIDNPNYSSMIYLEHNKQPMRILNLSSLYSGYKNITDLITLVAPINNTGMPHNQFVDSVDFDLQYANALMNDPVMFHHLMEIMIPSREGEIVVILVQHDIFRDAVMESLIKFIQQRYGYNSWILDDPADVPYLKETPFSPYGLVTLDQDILRHDTLCNAGVCDSILPCGMNLE